MHDTGWLSVIDALMHRCLVTFAEYAVIRWTAGFEVEDAAANGMLLQGLTLGLMSLDQIDLEVLKRSGTPLEKKQAARIAPVRTALPELGTYLACWPQLIHQHAAGP